MALIFSGCFGYGNNTITPQIHYSVSDWRVQSLPSAFPPLSEEELSHEWAKEYKIGVALAKQLDLYRAVTAFKRADILVSEQQTERKREVQYYTLLSYYLGKRYEDVIDTFHASDLVNVSDSFPVYEDLIIILYESFLQIGENEQAEHLLSIMQHHNQQTASKLKLSKALQKGELFDIVPSSYSPEVSQDNEILMRNFQSLHKSERTAQSLNALIPGAGYLYVGQKQTALTALLLNGLSIASSVYFFQKGNLPMGILMTSFEAGWYFGGIYGAGMAAREYNERLYENNANQVMRKNELFPVLTLRHAF